jgi:hypothetical protein
LLRQQHVRQQTRETLQQSQTPHQVPSRPVPAAHLTITPSTGVGFGSTMGASSHVANDQSAIGTGDGLAQSFPRQRVTKQKTTGSDCSLVDSSDKDFQVAKTVNKTTKQTKVRLDQPRNACCALTPLAMQRGPSLALDESDNDARLRTRLFRRSTARDLADSSDEDFQVAKRAKRTQVWLAHHPRLAAHPFLCSTAGVLRLQLATHQYSNYKADAFPAAWRDGLFGGVLRRGSQLSPLPPLQ